MGNTPGTVLSKASPFFEGTTHEEKVAESVRCEDYEERMLPMSIAYPSLASKTAQSA